MGIDTNRPRQVAAALTEPSAVLLAGAGAAAAIVAGAPLVIAAGVGALAWAARVAVALPRTRRAPRVEPLTLKEPWRSFVDDALDARRRFARAVEATREGPVRDRMREVGGRIDQAVHECYEVAQRGERLTVAIRQLPVAQMHRELDYVEGQLHRSPGRADLESTARSLRDQIASAERLQALLQETLDRLTRINAQLDEAVVRAVELSVGVSDVAGVSPLGSDVDALVTELESLRDALEETGGTTATG